MYLSNYGEEYLTNFIQKILNVEKDSLNNDVSYFKLSRSKYLVVKIDGYVESTSRLPFQSLREYSRKCVYACASDLLVKLVKPEIGLTSITVPNMRVVEFEEIIQGLCEGFREFEITCLGGDLNEGNEISINIVMLGFTEFTIHRRPRVGDILVTPFMYGYTGIIFKLLNLDKLDQYVKDKVVVEGIEMLRIPKLDKKLPEKLRPYINYIHASMDSSDGLGRVLWTMARLGRVTIEVNTLPTSIDLLQFCKQLEIDPLEVIFNGGEEYLPIFAIDSSVVYDFERLGYLPFARVTDKGDGKVLHHGKELRFTGWEYFKHST